MEMGEVVEQFSLSHNSTIKSIVDMLKKYHDNVLAKISLQGYDSDDCPRVTSQKSKLKSTKYLSRNSIRLSSNSLNNHDSDSRSTGSEKHIRYIDESFIKSAKNFHTIDGNFFYYN